MQAKHAAPSRDWHQQLLASLFKSPLVSTRVGSAFTSIGHLLRFNLSDSFPATTAKRLMVSQVARELFCFLNALTSKQDLHKHGVTIWDADMMRAGKESIGPIYGYQWRKWGGEFDQLTWAVNELIKTNGSSRRALVSAWNPLEVLSEEAVLPPCHVMFQFNIVSGTLYTDVYQRSADAFLGLPFDVASFGILSRLVKNTLLRAGLDIGEEQLNYHISNLHLYEAHAEAAEKEISNEASGEKPKLICFSTIDTFDYNSIALAGYTETRLIKAKLLT